MIKKIIATVLAILTLTSLGLTAFAENPPAATPEGYESVAENSGYKLYADMTTGDFAVFDITAAHWWYSGQNAVMDKESDAFKFNTGRIKTELVSMISVKYVQISTIASTAVPLYQNSYAYCVMEDNVKVSKIDNGYRAEYYFSDIGTTVPVEIVLTQKGIAATIVGNDLKIGKDFRVISISLLPGFLASDNTYSGYLFVPSGSGGLIPLNAAKGDITTYSETVYGDDTALKVDEFNGEGKNIYVPVYGIKCNDYAVTAIITKGDTTAKINADSDSLSTTFSRVYSEYVTSVIDNTTLFESNYENQRVIYGAENRDKYSDYSVSFTFLYNEKADYSGMAEVYRNHLDLRSNSKAPKLNLSLYGAAEKKASFLGIPYNKKIALTSFKDAQKVIEYFNSQDISVALQYIGWNNSGIYNKKAAAKVSPVSVLGGKSGYKKFLEYADGSENDIYLDCDFMLIKKSGNGVSKFSDVCKSIFNTRTPIYNYMLSVYVPVNNENPSYLLIPEAVKRVSDKFFKKYSYSAGVSLNGFGDKLYSNFSSGASREQTKQVFTDILSNASKQKTIALSGANAYTYNYTDRIYSVPMSCDGNILISEAVPFIQMVLHGSVSYGAEKGSSLLDCIEYGADPYFSGIYSNSADLMETSYNWLYSSDFENWKAEAAEIFTEYEKIYNNLYNRTIAEHEKADGVSKTVFDDGTVILVNRNNKDVTVDGVTVTAGGYAVTRR